MAIDPKQAHVADMVCTRFLNMRAGTDRHALVVAVKDYSIIDHMANHSLLRDAGNRTLYFPTLGTFALLPDDDRRLLDAKLGTLQILHTLANLFEVDGSTINYSASQIVEAASKRYDDADPRIVRLGLYLVNFPGLEAVQACGRSSDNLEVTNISIAEGILKIDNPDSTWQRCVEMSRRAAQAAEESPALALPSPRDNPAPAPPRGRQKPWLPDGWIFVKLIAEGGQGRTYKVKRKSDEEGNLFVFKRLKNADRADRFDAEIKALQDINHPGILQIEEKGTTEGKPYYIAEYCANGDLSQRNFAGTTTLEKLFLFRKICSAVAAAHSANIVHRDIKPSNILVRSDGSIAVGDFGLCLHLKAEERLTQTEEAVGARYYMAPELEDGRREGVTPAADVYSLGKLLYFLLGGRSFSREKHREPPHDLTHPAEGQAENSIHFAYEILDKSIVESPTGRFPNAAELLTAVDGAIRKMVMNAHALDLKIRQPCLYCADGDYRIAQGSQLGQYNASFVCWACGNIQHFMPPYNGFNAWWMKR